MTALAPAAFELHPAVWLFARLTALLLVVVGSCTVGIVAGLEYAGGPAVDPERAAWYGGGPFLVATLLWLATPPAAVRLTSERRLEL